MVSLTNATNRPSSHRAQAPNPYDVGQWELSFTAAASMSHAAVLPNGKVLYWTGNTPPVTDSHLWNCVISNGLCDPDVAGNNKEAIPYSTVELFCSGHSHLPDGRLFVAGGISPTIFGTPLTTIFNLSPSSSSPPPATSGPTMTNGRWYPTTVTLGNGETGIVSGIYCPTPGSPCGTVFNTIPEVINSAGTSLRTLSTAPEPANELALYPWLYLGSDGRVFRAGPLSPSRWLDTAGTGAWGTTVKPHFNGAAIPNRDFGAAVMYRPDEVLITGGGQYPGPTNTSETINLKNEIGDWTATTEPMEYARRHHNLTILANGQVLATGGTDGEGFNNTCAKNVVYPAELWDPDKGTWTTMASMSIRRLYHSVAVLLIDGRVLVGGTTFESATPGCDPTLTQTQQEIFSPRYLFNPDGTPASRPRITSAPATISYGPQFFVGTPSSFSIAKVTMVRLSSVTHSVNMNQRFNQLTFSRVGSGLRVNSPTDPNVCPPGHYMLFIINSAGVPSVAKIVQIQ
ncbi:MAG: DUF1929 domain-containing protein [Acidobacteria bacterium]|nr:DUF1929 domain-containing protein [Acidobacteriota bacterium]